MSKKKKKKTLAVLNSYRIWLEIPFDLALSVCVGVFRMIILFGCVCVCMSSQSSMISVTISILYFLSHHTQHQHCKVRKILRQKIQKKNEKLRRWKRTFALSPKSFCYTQQKWAKILWKSQKILAITVEIIDKQEKMWKWL